MKSKKWMENSEFGTNKTEFETKEKKKKKKNFIGP